MALDPKEGIKAVTNNPFLDMDFSKVMQDFKMPGVDMDQLMASQKKNIDAVTKANQVAFEGVQAVARRQADILRSTMEEVQNLTKDLMATTNPQDRMNKQAEVAKTAFETSLKNIKELADMLAKSNNEAFDLLNKRMGEVMEEVQTAVSEVQKSAQQATK